MNRQSRQSERGMALVLAIFALVVVGALVASAFLVGHLEQRTGRSTLYAEQAADAAEAGAAETIASWNALNLNALAQGTTAAFPPVPLAGRSAYRRKVSRLNGQIFLVQSLGTRVDAGGNTLARRTVGIVARLASLGSGPEAALTVAKPVEIEGSQVSVSGADSIGTREGLACAPASARPATRVAPSSSTVYAVFGDVTFDRLAAHANHVLPDTTLSSPLRPSVTGSGRRCDTADDSNWGEPSRSVASEVAACRRYFPILYARGTRLGIAGGGRAQGILLVEGNLDISGDFDFRGLIVVKGAVRISGGRTRITGGLMAANATGDSRNRLAGATTIQYSSCALAEALGGVAFAEPLGQRSWVQLY
jgi:hypothetical protein